MAPWRRWLDRIDLFRRLIINGLFLLLLLILLALWLMRDVTPLPEKAVLRIQPQGTLVETVTLPNPRSPLQWLSPPTQVPVHELVRIIRTAKDDPAIVGLQLELDELGRSPLPRLEMLRRAIADFRSAGKPVVAYGNRFSQGQYFVASAANRIVMHPLGFVEITGIGVFRNYFRQALERLHVDVHVVHAGKYKSAIEPLLRDRMSPAAREANRRWLEQSWQFYRDTVGRQRKQAAAILQRIADDPAALMREVGGDAARMALKHHLVDALGSRQESRAQMARLLHVEADALPAMIEAERYALHRPQQPPSPETPWVGVLVASGTVLPGKQPAGTIGAENLARQLRQLAEDPRYKAIVLRLDSPGGSALASETIRQAILQARKRKPVVVSMGSVAASGGYWIASAADAIVAEPASLTGSIGVFGVIVKAERALQRLGILSDGIGTARMSGALRADRPLPDTLKAALQMGVDHIYQRFLAVVAEGRRLSPSQVARAADGRVWIAGDALKLGLIDRLGTLDDAVAMAAQRAGLPAYAEAWVQPERNWRDILMARLLGGLMAPAQDGARVTDLVLERLGPWLRLLAALQDRQQAIFALWPLGLDLIAPQAELRLHARA